MKYQLINPINENYSPLEQVLTNRGFQLQDIPHYLHLSQNDVLPPERLDNIDRAIELLIKHITNGKIFVQVDSDCDGYTSSALLLNYIYKEWPSAISRVSYDFHDGKTHGIDISAIPEGTTLVIAPDSSSNDYDIHKQLYDSGIDVLVIDHHLADKVSEYACVVNNQLCDYPNKTLSGVGVVYKVCQRIDQWLEVHDADDFIDLVMLGLVGDMMDIRNMETRFLIQEGMNNVSNPFISTMAEKNSFSLKGQLTPIGVAFYIVPFINAITRVGTRQEKKLIFESMLEWKAKELVPSTKRGCKGQMETLVDQAVRTSTNVKNRQTRARDTGAEMIESIIKEKGLLNNKLLLIKLRQGAIDRGIAGLIANELMSKYQRPVAILSETIHEGKRAWEGSARGYDKSSMKDFRQLCRNSGLTFLSEGHQNAFGLGIYDQDFDAFVTWTNEQLKDVEFTPMYRVDFIYHSDDVQPRTILDLGDHKELWGQNIDEPLIAIEHVNVTKDMVTLMSRDKNPTLKIQLGNGVACIKFRSNEDEYESLCSENGCVTLNIVGRPEVNRYYDSVTPQLLIVDYEIINKQEYYF